jgi:AcrR family transcriptional regulator
MAAIYTSVGQLIAEGSDRISFPVIAERAGVNPTTLYRRWADIGELLEEVSVAALTREHESAPDTGSLQGDLTEWATAIARDITRPERTRYLRAMVSARIEMVSNCPVMDTRSAQASEMVERAADRGELTPSASQILDHVISPLYHRIAFALPVDDDYARQLVADVLAMVR